MGNKFLSHVREVDAVVHVVRCFFDPNVSHVYNQLDPVRDVEIIETELILADLETVGRRIDKRNRSSKQAISGPDSRWRY